MAGPQLREFAGGGLAVLRLARADIDGGAVLEQAASHEAADAARSARDQGHAPAQIDVVSHEDLLGCGS